MIKKSVSEMGRFFWIYIGKGKKEKVGLIKAITLPFC